MDRALNEALAKVDAFIAEHPEYSRQGVQQPGQGSTNRVVFAKRRDNPVVFKIFCEVERKERECFGLRHWCATGLVPELIWDADPRMIVMAHVPGVYLSQAREAEGDAAWRDACRHTARAIATLTRVPLTAQDRTAFESRFYQEQPTLAAYLSRILELGRAVHARDPDFRDAFWRENLDYIEAQISGILAQPAVLYDQDVGNLHVQHGRFAGFFDLEMCRVGCAAMQLGSSLDLVQEEDGTWELFREGWEGVIGSSLGPADRNAAAAASHFLAWRRITRWISYDGTPGTGYDWATPADPAKLRKSIEAVNHMLRT